jgi:RimJ/RimL family protein N-acetyltransferase
VHVYLETERLLLRRFTIDDVDDIVALDSDPEVMRYINGGEPTPREEIETDYLLTWLSYYERFTSFGFWAAVERRAASSSAGFTSARHLTMPSAMWSSAIGCAGRHGVRVTRPRRRVR